MELSDIYKTQIRLLARQRDASQLIVQFKDLTASLPPLETLLRNTITEVEKDTGKKFNPETLDLE